MKRRNFLQTIAYSSLGACIPSVYPIKTFDENPSELKPASILKRFGDGRDWFFEKRFDMFIHWGLYPIPGWHERHQLRARVERSL